MVIIILNRKRIGTTSIFLTSSKDSEEEEWTSGIHHKKDTTDIRQDTETSLLFVH